jgi:hypothetical protein
MDLPVSLHMTKSIKRLKKKHAGLQLTQLMLDMLLKTELMRTLIAQVIIS